MLTNFPETLRARECWENHRRQQLFGTAPGPHNGVGPGGVGKAQSENTSSIVLILSRLRQRQVGLLNSFGIK